MCSSSRSSSPADRSHQQQQHRRAVSLTAMRVLLLLGALVAVAFCGRLAGKALRGSRRGEGDDGPWRLRRLRGARDGGAAAADEASSRRAKGGWFSGESDDPPDVPDGASSKARVPAAAPTKSNASVANPPSPAVTFALGMVSACCVEQHRRRRDMHRAIFADYVAGRVGQREALPEGSMALYFVVGHPKDDPNFETLREGSELREELTTAKDIVRLKAEDSYLNLYKKTDMFLAWALLHTTARYIIKVDDDCYVNYRSLYDISLSNFGSDPYGVYLGSHHHFVPIRKASSKWYVSEEQWPNHCPESKYADGWMYMLSRDVASAASAVLRSASEFVDGSTQSHPNPLTNETSVELWGVPELHTDPQLQGLPTTDGLRVPTWHPDLETRSASGPARDGNECSLNRIWFEDARVGIAVSRAFAGAEWVFSRLSRSSRYFASAWHCCYHDTIVKHLDFGCSTKPTAVLPKLHAVLNKTIADKDRIQCVHKSMGSCGKSAMDRWLQFMTGGEGFGTTCDGAKAKKSSSLRRLAAA